MISPLRKTSPFARQPMNSQVNMPSDFSYSDELLSAYLDGELNADERAAVEQQLAASEADHQLLNELRTLRSQLSELPRAVVSPDFADRVVQAAIQQATLAAEAPATVTVTRKDVPRIRSAHVAVGIVTGLAACLLLALGLRWYESPGSTLSPSEQIVAAFRSFAPEADEAVVLRIRFPSAMSPESLDAALAQAGITLLPGSELAPYAKEASAVFSGQLSNAATVAVADALFVEAPLQKIESALAALAQDMSSTLELAGEARFALSPPPPPPTGENQAATTARELPKSFVQHVPADRFRLEQWKASGGGTRSDALVAGASTSAARVLILIERVEARP